MLDATPPLFQRTVIMPDLVAPLSWIILAHTHTMKEHHLLVLVCDTWITLHFLFLLPLYVYRQNKRTLFLFISRVSHRSW